MFYLNPVATVVTEGSSAYFQLHLLQKSVEYVASSTASSFLRYRKLTLGKTHSSLAAVSIFNRFISTSAKNYSRMAEISNGVLTGPMTKAAAVSEDIVVDCNGMDDNGIPTAAAARRSLAPWRQPKSYASSDDQRGKLRLLNSLTRNKEIFVPQNGNKVNWYICGPTVYDAAHMGHARSYISFDILRRVVQNYFGYDVQFVMNITDIDDKIIKRARQRYLTDQYLENTNLTVQKVITDVLAAMIPFKQRFQNETNLEKKTMLEHLVAKVEKCVNQLEISLRSKDEAKIEQSKNQLLIEARDVLSDWLDQQFGSQITDHSIFMNLARKFEAEFYSDMTDLNILPADVVTRVSEYVPEIIRFIQKIIQNGYAYEANGSVYFDTNAFNSSPKHYYAKLVPEAYNDDDVEMSNAMREAEGELTESKQSEKGHCNDFALWKASKTGEPSWPSPWGQGRPGWHVECSVMATEILGETLDIHAGGFDLKFPHHDNELAQTEACFDCEQWVNYFLHAGTLKIAGLKMSKSLKNFITIKEALRQYTARQLRLLFLLHNWSECLDYSASTMESALKFEKICNEFFLQAKFYVREHFHKDQAASYAKFLAEELQLSEKFADSKRKVHEALCDSVDTRMALEAMKELISHANVYINKTNAERKIPNILLIRNIALYLSKVLKIFGVNAISEDDEIGFSQTCGSSATNTSDNSTANGQIVNGNGSCLDKEELLMPYVKAMADFREKIRQIAIDAKLAPILDECDRLRNDVLPALGVRLEDRETHTMVKLCDPEELLRERRQEAEQREKIRAEKERKKAEAATREAKRRLPPGEFFRQADERDKYSQFDERGIPTHDHTGAELSKAARKKLEKLFAQQEQRYNEYMAASAANNDDNLASAPNKTNSEPTPNNTKAASMANSNHHAMMNGDIKANGHVKNKIPSGGR